MNNFIVCKSILLMSLFLSAPNALAQPMAYDTDGIRTYIGDQSSYVSAPDVESPYGQASSRLTASIYENDPYQPGPNGEVSIDTFYDSETGFSESRVSLLAASSSSCMGGRECGAQIFLSQAEIDGFTLDPRITMLASQISLEGNVSLYDDNGSSIDNLADYVTTNRDTAYTNGVIVNTNATGVATNTTGVAANAADIATNTTGVATNTTGVANNAADIATNTTGVAANAADIATNTTGVANNAADIATNTTGVANNVATLTVHEGLITQNIADIAANVTTLTAHTTSIGANMTAIGNLQSSFTNFQAETMNNFARMGSDMHRGLAEVTALSNVAYADKGWRASIGYGDYENKSAAAVGISYAGEKFKFKASRSGKATGAGIAFDF